MLGDEELLAVYDIAVHEEYLRQTGVRFAVVPRVHGLRAVSDRVCRQERHELLAAAAQRIRQETHGAGGTLPVARVLELLEELEGKR